MNRVRLMLGIVATLGVLTTTPRELTVTALRDELGTDRALVVLRTLVNEHIAQLPTPVGFCRHHESAWKKPKRLQHKVGPDPPP